VQRGGGGKVVVWVKMKGEGIGRDGGDGGGEGEK